MSLLWYYQPEHTEAGRKPNHMENEVFASRHRDENSVACIDDKCYVLTYDQYCRWVQNTVIMKEMYMYLEVCLLCARNICEWIPA